LEDIDPHLYFGCKLSAAALFFHIDQHLKDRDITGDLEATFIYSLCLTHLYSFPPFFSLFSFLFRGGEYIIILDLETDNFLHDP
jgi:hypothetical protein